MNDKPPLDDFHRHEVLHTASIIAAMFDEYIAQHDFTRNHPELAAMSDDLSERLATLYQLIGQH